MSLCVRTAVWFHVILSLRYIIYVLLINLTTVVYISLIIKLVAHYFIFKANLI
jgi:hypothetical protein